MWSSRGLDSTKDIYKKEREKKKKNKQTKKEKKEQRRIERRQKKQEKKRDIREQNSRIILEILKEDPLLRQEKVVCCDLYWTLINRPNSLKMLKEVLSTIWINPLKKYHKIIQTNSKEEVEWIYKSTEGLKFWDYVIGKFNEHTQSEIDGTKVFSDTIEFLKKIKENWYKLALISNISEDFKIPLRKYIPEWLFDYEIFSYKVRHMKPDIEIFEEVNKVAEKKDGLVFKMSDMLMIGDSIKDDIEWGKNAWMKVMLIKRKDDISTDDNEWSDEIKVIRKTPIEFNKKKNLIIVHTLYDIYDILGIDY